jgi:hypothetical protein
MVADISVVRRRSVLVTVSRAMPSLVAMARFDSFSL